LRHGAATLALAAGTDLKVVQDQLGHSTIVLTADISECVASKRGFSLAAVTFQLSARVAGERCCQTRLARSGRAVEALDRQSGCWRTGS
jgi:hypothetical protein